MATPEPIKTEPTPKGVLQSEQFWTLIVSAIIMVVVSVLPEAEAVRADLIEALTYITVAVVAGQSLGVSEVVRLLITRQNVQAAIDAGERITGKDIPDNIETLLVDLIAAVKTDATTKE